MKKTLALVILLVLSMACTISLPGSSFEEDVAVGVALAFTETAMQTTADAQNPNMTSQPVSTAAPTATGTPPADDPKTVLGNPDWSDSLSSGQNWGLDSGDVTYDDTTFSQADGKLTAENNVTGNGMIWKLTYFEFENAYLEATFETENCSASDQYGLLIRAADYTEGPFYYLYVTCNGAYGLGKYGSNTFSTLSSFDASDAINSGSNQTNSLGIWIENDIIRLYANNQFLTEITDSSISGAGHFGLISNAVQTPGFTIHMDEIAYWLID
jgi:hypothetical protein